MAKRIFKASRAIQIVSILLATELLGSTVSLAQPHGINVLSYRQPAKKWESEALPIGNGLMGAMLFGGIDQDRIQFNEQSLWSGDNNWDGGYDCGDHGFGAYRNFGDLIIDFGNDGRPVLDSPSGDAEGNGQPIANTVDGKNDSKWCIENPGKAVMWQVSLSFAREVKSYSLTSAADVPSRDPSGAISVTPAEPVVSRIHFNIRQTARVQSTFAAGKRDAQLPAGMTWFGLGGILENLRP